MKHIHCELSNLIEQFEYAMVQIYILDSVVHSFTCFAEFMELIFSGCVQILKMCCVLCRLLDVLDVEPDNGNATFNLAIVYFDLGRHGDAETYYRKVLSTSPNDKGTLYNLGIILTERQRLVRAGFTVEWLVRAGFTVEWLVRAGFTVEWLVSAGFTGMVSEGKVHCRMVSEGRVHCGMVSEAGFTAAWLVRAGFTVEWLVRAGFTVE